MTNRAIFFRIPYPWRRGLLLGSLTLLLSCSQQSEPVAPIPTAAARQAQQARPAATELRFDERYLDSIRAPRSTWSERTRRQNAIDNQLGRLRLVKWSIKADSASNANRGPQERTSPANPLMETYIKGQSIHWPNSYAQLADIYHKLDSLKVLEHIPLTPNPPLYPPPHED